jgi:alanyl-tRNA synthetase
VYGISKDRLYVTYFEGDIKNGLKPDEEARQYWLDQGVPADHVLPGNAKDNFWGKDTTLHIQDESIINVSRDGSHWAVRSVQVGYMTLTEC